MSRLTEAVHKHKTTSFSVHTRISSPDLDLRSEKLWNEDTGKRVEWQ